MSAAEAHERFVRGKEEYEAAVTKVGLTSVSALLALLDVGSYVFYTTHTHKQKHAHKHATVERGQKTRSAA